MPRKSPLGKITIDRQGPVLLTRIFEFTTSRIDNLAAIVPTYKSCVIWREERDAEKPWRVQLFYEELWSEGKRISGIRPKIKMPPRIKAQAVPAIRYNMTLPLVKKNWRRQATGVLQYIQEHPRLMPLGGKVVIIPPTDQAKGTIEIGEQMRVIKAGREEQEGFEDL
jgi:hypothetical protein